MMRTLYGSYTFDKSWTRFYMSYSSITWIRKVDSGNAFLIRSNNPRMVTTMRNGLMFVMRIPVSVFEFKTIFCM